MLPSSAAACLVMLAHARWMTRHHWQATFWAVAAVLVRFLSQLPALLLPPRRPYPPASYSRSALVLPLPFLTLSTPAHHTH